MSQQQKSIKLSVNTFRLMSEKILRPGFQTDGTRSEFEKQTAMNLYFRLITENDWKFETIDSFLNGKKGEKRNG